MTVNIVFNRPWLVSLILAGCVTACSSTKKSRYALEHDLAPTRTPTAEEMQNPEVYYMPPSRGGNQPEYQVLGKTYQVLPSADGFEQQGIASWYGRKFHGHLTSNGETYDMFAMSAAHKTLPIPVFVEVTNLDNGRKAIVRVNDRGPFHEGRIIDLSYSAAYKLGVTASGTANVKIRTLATTPGGYILVDSAPQREGLDKTASALALLFQMDTQVLQAEEEFDLLVGPFADEERLRETLAHLTMSGYPAKRYTQTSELTNKEEVN
ncbi:septal ring lytic transglycosylase RlpA [Saccharobesus litoralis]|uniref:Endolytic peptidoglycan transglycosylase RlpA n=1 Tax=Saccharobesus litoralis TaxID=2172099 RepID=A0A2S0VVN8_9ALTE|nr:septal ring lytic transglycosylase RlpA family protein [Saccharobesus litoralis]AWB68281.1 septal ring lytic transglycosylase RlpA [Saccharobesus litoralis]